VILKFGQALQRYLFSTHFNGNGLNDDDDNDVDSMVKETIWSKARPVCGLPCVGVYLCGIRELEGFGTS